MTVVEHLGLVASPDQASLTLNRSTDAAAPSARARSPTASFTLVRSGPRIPRAEPPGRVLHRCTFVPGKCRSPRPSCTTFATGAFASDKLRLLRCPRMHRPKIQRFRRSRPQSSLLSRSRLRTHLLPHLSGPVPRPPFRTMSLLLGSFRLLCWRPRTCPLRLLRPARGSSHRRSEGAGKCQPRMRLEERMASSFGFLSRRHRRTRLVPAQSISKRMNVGATFFSRNRHVSWLSPIDAVDRQATSPLGHLLWSGVALPEVRFLSHLRRRFLRPGLRKGSDCVLVRAAAGRLSSLRFLAGGGQYRRFTPIWNTAHRRAGRHLRLEDQ